MDRIRENNWTASDEAHAHQHRELQEMMSVTKETLESLVGHNVRVVKSFLLGGRTIESRTEGRIVSVGKCAIGTSFAPGRNREFWVTQFTLEKPDGEKSLFSLDESIQVEELAH